MIILRASAENFASYKKLQFEFTDQGLTLISGPTGAGKSTLCDLIPWTLFSCTAKNGSVEDICSWNSSEPTQATAVLRVGSSQVYITRVRGKTNDLHYGVDANHNIRGKDLNDTQKQINQLLNMSAETYLAGAYLHEFSQTAQFFTTSAKNRRVITEQLADLSLANNLQEKSNEYKKELKLEIERYIMQVAVHKRGLEELKKNYANGCNHFKKWEHMHERDIYNTEQSVESFDIEKAKSVRELIVKLNDWQRDMDTKKHDIYCDIEAEYLEIMSEGYYYDMKAELSEEIEKAKNHKCTACDAPLAMNHVMVLTKELYELEQKEKSEIKVRNRIDGLQARITTLDKQINPYLAFIDKEKQRVNVYIEQLEKFKNEENPYAITLDNINNDITTTSTLLNKFTQSEEELRVELADIALLQDTVSTLRSVLLERTVVFLERTTNSLLNDHFDAEIRVTFCGESADKLEVEITKDGNLCTYTQLSKGQRQLLKLCFGVSVMQAISNYNGTNFNCLFFDECLDGMDDNIKAKSFTLLEKLATNFESIFVVEHSESFKSFFLNRYEVQLVNGSSEIGKL